MNITRFALDHRPVTLVVAAVALFAGVNTFLTMSRRENPRITIRVCQIDTQWPGASAEKVEDLVTEAIEDVVYQIEEVESIESMSRTGFSRIEVELEDAVGPDEIDQVWDKVRDKVDLVRSGLPDGCGQPFVNSDFGDVSSVCLVIHPVEPAETAPSYSYRELEDFADDLETALKTIPDVSSVTAFGVPDEVITLGVEAGTWAKLGISPEQLASAIDERNLPNAGVVLSGPDRRYPIRPTGELSTVEDLRRVPVTTVEGQRTATVRDLPFDIDRSAESPRRSGMRFVDPQSSAPRAVLLGVAMKEGRNVVELGEQIDRVVRAYADQFLPADVAVTRVNDLPRQVDGLVSDFMESLWQAIVIVLGVAWLMMGWRPALVMATAIPLSMITTLAIVPSFDVELEQFAIASLIIVLGMVVDNAIVVTDNVQRLLDDGKSPRESAIEGATSLARPVLSSTLTTVGAFLPMITIPGETGEYMRSLPVVVSATLLTSYLVAMAISPLMCAIVLRPTAARKENGSRLTRAYTRLVKTAVSRRLLTLGLAGAAVAGSIGLVPVIGSQFFPGGVRDQFFVDITLPNGSSLAATERVVEQVERILVESSPAEFDGEQVERLVNATAFVGTGGPRMILSLDPGDGFRNEAMILVNTLDPDVSRPWVEEVRREVGRIPGARIEVRPYELGPPIDNPVEFRFAGPDLAALRQAGAEMLDLVEAEPGTSGGASDWGELSYAIDLELDSDRATLAGVSSDDVATSLRQLYGGESLTTLREGSHLVDIQLRLNQPQRESAESLDEVYVGSGTDAVLLSSVASANGSWEHAAINRRNRVRTMTIGARVEPGFLANEVATSLEPKIRSIVDGLPGGYAVEVGGESEETTASQASVSAAMMISVVVIFLVLLMQYNSVSKPFVVLTAFPLSLIGALFGLFVTGWPLGFMPLLGVVALAGTVINNAIVLIEFIENAVAEGEELVEAVARAGLARMQPILLTTLTTIGGLLPLALFGGPMWAGMSWAMIFGLAISTVLTLVVIPTVYVLFVRRLGMKAVS
ncbi:MAG: efflux RND transporter permease subunit [Planctomycetota bacterium]